MHKKNIAVFILIGVLMLASCKQVKEAMTLAKCDFRLKEVTSLQLAQVELWGLKSYSDISFTDIGKMGVTFASGHLPLDLRLNLEIRNPNSAKAALNRLDWILLVDKNQIAEGTTQYRVEVQPNGGIASMPLTLSTDLKQALTGQSLKSLINLALNFFDKGGTPSRLTIKAKPWISIGNSSIAYPGYINIKKEFGSEQE
jgi:hypothetical protein